MHPTTNYGSETAVNTSVLAPGGNEENAVKSVFNTMFINTEDQDVPSEDELLTPNTLLEVYDRHTISGAELLSSTSEPVANLVEGLIRRKTLMSLIGGSETGKSTLARDLCYAIATGAKEYFGRSLGSKYQNIIYVSSEDGLDIIREYLKERNGQNPPEQLKGFRVLKEVEKPTDRLRAALETHPADLIVMDVFSDLFTGDINQSGAVRNFMKDYQKLVHDFDVVVLFIHHTGKRTEIGSPSKNNAVGSQAFEAKMRLVMELRADSEDDDMRHLCIVKGNYLKPEDKKHSMRLRLNVDRSYTFMGTGPVLKDLGSAPGRKGVQDADVLNKVLHLHSQGVTIVKIAETLKGEGIQIEKSTVWNLLKKHKQNSGFASSFVTADFEL